jgi:hypothetical protein
MPAPFVGPLIGAGIGALGSLFGGGGPEDFLNDDARAFIEQYQRTYGPQAFEDLIRGQGQFAGPLVEQFGPESVERFMNPFAEQSRERIAAGAERSRDLARRDAIQSAARVGSQRGSRAGVAMGERLGAVDRAELDALANLDLSLYGQAGQLALGAQPFRNQFLQEPIMRHQLGMEALNFGLGPREAYTNPRAAEKDPNILSGAIGGAITGAGFFPSTSGGGSPLSAGTIRQITGPTPTVNPFQIPGNFSFPTAVPSRPAGFGRSGGFGI